MLKQLSRVLATVGGVLAVVAPKGLCPVCIAASGGVLASLGLGAFATEQSIRRILGVTLAIAIVGLAASARSHRRWWPVALAAAGAAAVVAGRFLLLDAMLYGGMVLLVGASASDFWARRHPRTRLVQIRLNRGAP